MENQLDLLEIEALKLSADEREVLAQRLLASLDKGAEHDAAWAFEVERRVAEIESGSVQPVPIADALAQIRAQLK